jgi:hypothetical protein
MITDASGSGVHQPRENPNMTRPIYEDEFEEPLLALSPVIDQAINVMNEREEQRHKLVNTLIVVQLLTTAAVSLGYHDKPGLIFPITLASLGVYLLALVAGYLLRNTQWAAYLLVFGGGAAVAAQVIAAMLTGSPEEVGHLALFFLAIMIEAGLLLLPQITVAVALLAGGLTGGLLLLLAVNQAVSASQIYQIVLYTLSPLALTGIIAWLLAHFIYATNVVAQHAQDLEFRQAQFSQMKQHEQERQEQLDESIGAIQSAIAQANTGDYTVRVPVSSGDLEVVENSLNLLLDNFEAISQTQQENARMKGAVVPMAEELMRMDDPKNPLHSVQTDTPIDNLSVIASRLADSYNRRLIRLQEQLGRVSSGVAHSRDGLANAANGFSSASGQAGALISRADAVQESLQKQMELLGKARRMLATLLPPEITQMVGQNEGGNPALRGLGIGVERGLTSEFDALSPAAPASPGEAGIAPLTLPLPAVTVGDSDESHGSSDGSDGKRGGTNAAGADGETDAATPAMPATPARAAGSAVGGPGAPVSSDMLPAELIEVWHLLLQIGDELTQQERAMATFTQDLGVLSRNVRNADRGMSWTLAALDAVQRSSDMAQQSSAQHAIPGETDGGFSDGQDSGGFSPRPAGPSRPLWPSSGAPDGSERPLPQGSVSGADLLGGNLLGGDAPDDGSTPDRGDVSARRR